VTIDKARKKKRKRKQGQRIPYHELRQLSGRQIAAMFGVTSPAVTAWVHRGCPRNDDGTYELAAVAGWHRQGALDLDRLPHEATAELLGVSRQALAQMARRGCPRNGDGSYDAGATVHWRIAELEQREQRARAAAGQGRARRDQAQAELAEIQLAERRAEVLPRVALVAGWVARYRIIQAMLLGMCRRLRQHGLDGRQIAAIEGDVANILEQLARGQPGLQLTRDEAALLRQKLPKRAGAAAGSG